MITADTIRKNQSAEITELAPGELGRRLGEMGFWPGRSLQLVNVAPFGGPRAYRLGKTLIALRKEEARIIRVKITASSS